MIRRKDQLTKTIAPLKGGKGNVIREDIIEGEELHGKAKIFSKITVPVGCSIGMHEHIEDFEVYYILSGKGKVLDNDKEEEVSVGDVVYTSNQKHFIENIGDEDLVFVAVVINI